MRVFTAVQWLQAVVKNSMAALPSIKGEPAADIEELKTAYEKSSFFDKKNIHKLIRQQLEINESIFILSYIVEILEIEDFWQDVAYWVSGGEFDCFTGSMLEVQLRTSGNIPYGQMRSIHRKNVKRFIREMGCEFPYIPMEKRNKNRIVIITEQLLDHSHAPTAMTLQTAYVLQKNLGYDVRVLTCAENKVLLFEQWMYAYRNNGNVEGKRKLIYKGSEINIQEYPMETCGLKGYREMISDIHQWNPLFVLNMGVDNPVADLPQKFTTVAARAMVTSAPVSEADILIRNVRGSERQEVEYARELEPHQIQVFMERKFPAIMKDTGIGYTRKELGLPENRFLVAIVGNRLDMEVDEPFIDVICQILKCNSGIDFVIIGEVSKVRERFETERLKERVHYLGYCEDLFAVYKVLNLYLNPKRLGGGWSSAIALRAELPVVTLPECDVAYSAGRNFEVIDYKEMIEVTTRYATDDEFYMAQRQKVQEWEVENGEERMLEYVTELVTKIREVMIR